MTNHYYYVGPDLVCDGVLLADIARAIGTPAYVYSAASIERAYAEMDGALGAYPHRIHYALKANSSLAIARLLKRLGSGVDANSVGEIEVALRAGFAPDDIVFSGVGKRGDELARAVDIGVHAINVESPGEAERIRAIAQAAGRVAKIAVRVTPDVDAETHPHITTGLNDSKFGMPADQVTDVCRDVAAGEHVRLVGLHVHIGSQILKVDPLVRAARRLVALASCLHHQGVRIEHLDVGGGMGIAYDDATVLTAPEYAEAVLEVVKPTGLRLLVEPGRWIVAPAGVLLTRVVDIKDRPGGSHFAVVDAGMTELLRPALYGAYHRIDPVVRTAGAERLYEIVGPLCESSDTFGKPRLMAPLSIGDVLAIRDTGGYGIAMASNYNRRPFPPEALVADGSWRTIRRRQTTDDLLALEV